MSQNSKNGVALIVVLGIMAVLAVLAVAFSKAMRDSRLAAKNYADEVKARHFTHVGLAEAMNLVDDWMAQLSTYPSFSQSPDADGSRNVTNPVCNLLVGEATNMIPRALWADALSVTCNWRYIRGTNAGVTTMTNGRVAYLILNCSGLLDANYIGGNLWSGGTSVAEMNLQALDLDVSDENRFYSDRNTHQRYETVAELTALNQGLIPPTSNLFVYSLDFGRDVYITNGAHVGLPDIQLIPKFHINGIADGVCSGYSSSALNAYVADINNTNSWLRANYWNRLAGYLNLAGAGDASGPPRISDVAGVFWNIVNYLDTDSVPQTGSLTPWLSNVGCEATPLINEIVFRMTNTQFRFDVELWYPFWPASAASNDYALQIVVWTNSPPAGSGQALNLDTVDAVSVTHLIGAMAFGNSNTEFRTYSSPTFSTTNGAWFLARVLDATTLAPVDQAINGTPWHFTNAVCYQINDPRLNSSFAAWNGSLSNTLNRMNFGCNPWASEGHGLPIYHRNGPMRNIGEIGHIHIPDLTRPWRNISLTNLFGGGALLDWLTVRPTNRTERGLVNILTRQSEVLRALFYQTPIGHINSPTTTNYLLDSADSCRLADAVMDGDPPGLNMGTILSLIGASDEYRSWRPYTVGGVDHSGDLKEDALRNIVELITLRQNLFTVIIAAQALSKDGQGVLAEKRAMAIVYRDAYTGQSFVRLFKWLSK